MTYNIYESVHRGVWRFVDSVDARTKAAAIRKHRASARSRGNAAPSWAKFKAEPSTKNPASALHSTWQPAMIRSLRNGRVQIKIRPR